MEKILVSACLLGLSTRYDGKSVPCDAVIKLSDRYTLIPYCPEIYGGLPTPRTPSERVGKKVVMKDGRDVTENYNEGAEGALELCRMLGIRRAVLKSKSPSCGSGLIYDGSFSGTLVKGAGVTAELLLSSGIEVFSEDGLSELDGGDNNEGCIDN
ncbi:MAG: DUF523 domain-containing protein [Clostridia bacterium]|nr:DUF523 domain-containing protein [Clostridia bacterium]